MLFPATVTLTAYDDELEPHKSTVSFGQYKEDDFECVEAGHEEGAKDEVQEVLIGADLSKLVGAGMVDVEVDKIEIHEAL